MRRFHEIRGIPGSNLVFFERFFSAAHVADNGGVISGDPTVEKGVALDSNDYITYPLSVSLQKASAITIYIELFIDGSWATDSTQRILFKEGANLQIEKNASNEIEVTVGGTGSATKDISGLTAGRHTVIVSLETNDLNLVVDGWMTDSDATVTYPTWGTTFTVGDAANSANTTITEVGLFTIELSTTPEIWDLHTNGTYDEIGPEDSLIWLPLRTSYQDGGGDWVTDNIGSLGGTVLFGDGAANTPTQIHEPADGINFSSAYLNLGTDPSLRLTAGGTVCCLVKFGARSNAQRLFDKSTAGPGANGYCIYTNTGTEGFTAAVSGLLTQSIGGVYKEGQFTTIFFTFSNSVKKIYVNGIDRTNTSNAGLPPDVADTLSFGDWYTSGGGNRYLNGDVFHISVFDIFISDTQARFLHRRLMRELNR